MSDARSPSPTSGEQHSATLPTCPNHLAIARQRIVNMVDPTWSGRRVKRAVLDILDAVHRDPEASS